MKQRNNVCIPTKLMGKKLNILVIGDLHIPNVHPEYLQWANAMLNNHRNKPILGCGVIVDGKPYVVKMKGE